MENTTITSEKQNSLCFRYAGTGTDVKLYFEDSFDLEKQLAQMESSADFYREKIQAIQEKMQHGN